MVGKAEIVVGAQKQHLGAVQGDAGALRPLDQSQSPVEPRRSQLIEAFADVAHDVVG